MLKRALIIIAVVVVAGCASAPETVAPETGSSAPVEASVEQVLRDGYELLSNRNLQAAIVQFDRAVSLCAPEYNQSGSRVYASRGLTETLYYLSVEAAKHGVDAIAKSVECSDALYLRGYAALDTGAVEQAQEFIQRAVDMAPKNALYLAELGHIYQVQRQWQRAFETFTEAESAALTFSPDEFKAQELARAKRGVGFSLIELGHLVQAELKFNEVLAANPDDAAAKTELNYIEQLRNPVQTDLFEEL